MPKSKLTLKHIFGLIGAIALLGLVFAVIVGIRSPEEALVEVVESQIPAILGVIVFLAGFGLVGAILIIIIIKLWEKIMNYNLLNLRVYL